MPPRYAYWTILIDNTPTAFRAREQAELLPTVAQLRRTNSNVVMKWFARGRIWDSPEAERDAQRRPPAGAEKRGREWRPGGAHRDPRDRFKKKDGDRQKFAPPRESRPWREKPAGTGKPAGPSAGDRPWQNKAHRPPSGPPRSDGAWQNRGHRPPSGQPSGERSSWKKSNTPPSGVPRRDKAWGGKTGKPQGPPRAWGAEREAGGKPWRDKPAEPPRGDRPWRSKPRDGQPFVPRDQRGPHKRRDDDPGKK
jgi:hypothetical protein